MNRLWHCYIYIGKVIFDVNLRLTLRQLKIDLGRYIVVLSGWLVLWLLLVIYLNVVNYWLLLAHLDVAIKGSPIMIIDVVVLLLVNSLQIHLVWASLDS